MYFTRETDGFKGWLVLVDKSGTLITGAVAGDFTVTVVDPADSTTSSPSVSESTQLSGLYTFTIPTAFFTTNGVGSYGVVVEVNKTTATKLTDALSHVLKVSLEDFDSLGIGLKYDGAVHIDTKNGAAGSVLGVNGTVDNPVSNLADAVLLAAAAGIRRYTLVGNITLTSAHDDWVIEGRAAEAAVALGGQDVADSLFMNVQISGAVGTGPIRVDKSHIDGVTNFTGHAHDCELVNTLVLGAGITTLQHCASGTPGLTTPAVDLNGVGSLNLRAYSGGVEIRNASGAGQNVTIELVAGQVILAATCTAGTITMRGIGNLTDNSLGSTIEKNAFLNLTDIAAALLAATAEGTLSVGDALQYMLAMAAGEFDETTVSGTVTDLTFKDRAGSNLFTLRLTDDVGRTRTLG